MCIALLTCVSQSIQHMYLLLFVKIGKEARKRELKKNKKQRMMVRQAVLKGKDPVKLLEEMEIIDKMGKSQSVLANFQIIRCPLSVCTIVCKIIFRCF